MGGNSELNRFQEHFRDYKIVVYQGLGCDDITFEGQVDSSKHLNLLYDYVERHYHVITNLTGAMAKRYVCKACHKSCGRDITHVCDQTCSDCMASPPCAFSDARTYCDECNRHFRSPTCYANHKQSTTKRKSVCERKRCCATCGLIVTDNRHECNKLFCANCQQNRDEGHLCYMRPLKDVLPDASNKVLYVFSDFETTQNTRYSDKATLYIPDLVCFQQFCSQCEDAEDCEKCVRCGQRKHRFWDDPVEDMLTYLCKPRPWANKIVAIAHNAKAFDLHFILKRASF